MNVLILGEHGQLGSELKRAAWGDGVQCRTVSQDELDFTDLSALPALLDSGDWHLLINAAAYTAVDKAESEPQLAFAINADAPATLAKQTTQRGIPIIHVSTDYVFDGTKAEPYIEDDPIAPINVYGQSKAAGEEAIRLGNDRHFILRTSWLYSAHGHNFLKSMMRLASERDELRIVNDQHGCPTAAGDLAGAIVHIAQLIARDSSVSWGTYHYAGDGATTWCGFAQAIIDAMHACGGKHVTVSGITSSEYPTAARRPVNSQLDCSRIQRVLGINTLPWQERCKAVVEECFAREAKVTQ